MARHRIAATCIKCGGTIEGIYANQEGIPVAMQLIGDTFIGWDYENHFCPETIVSPHIGRWNIKYKLDNLKKESFIFPK